MFRAIDGWRGVEDHNGWQDIVQQAEEDLATGHWLINQLGAERYLDPTAMAVLFLYRRKLIEEECQGQATASELMLIDSALITYRHFIRVTGWIGNLALLTEDELFHIEGPRVKWKAQGAEHELLVKDFADKLESQLFPLLDRLNRMLIRNLRTLRSLRTKPLPNVTIAGHVGQVNVAEHQQNAAVVQPPVS